MFDSLNQQLSGDRRPSDVFSDPFCDISGAVMPRNLREVFDWCEKLWLTHPTLMSACRRISRYFITDLELKGSVDETVIQKYREYVVDSMGALDKLGEAGDNRMCYGNLFVSLLVPFTRNLRCQHPDCGFVGTINNLEFKFDSKKAEFSGVCPLCGKQTTYFVHDEIKDLDRAPVRLKFWDPRMISINYNEYSLDSEYRLKLDPDFIKKIKDGDRFLISTTPMDFIKCACRELEYKFKEGRLFHLKEGALAGLRMNGWGLPLLLLSAKNAFYIQTLKMANEAFARDWVFPLRVASPVATTGGDALATMNFRKAKREIGDMINRRRQDPNSWFVTSYQMDYKVLGGEAKQLVTHDMINAATEEELLGMSIPVEFWKGSMTVDAAPLALRLMEKSYIDWSSGFSQLMNWICERISDLRNWKPVTARMTPCTLADNMAMKQLRLQLAQMGLLKSKREALRGFDIDLQADIEAAVDEAKQQMQQDAQMQQETQKEQEALQLTQAMAGQASNTAFALQSLQQQMAAAQAPQGAPQGDPAAAAAVSAPTPQGDVNSMTTPDQMMAIAQSRAQELEAMTPTARRAALLNMKQAQPALHAAVKAQLENLRQQNAQRGVEAGRGQQG